ncbi:MAG: pyridoxamine 5'-phosphate oxidase family protein [Sphingomonadales bacterium]|nr:pyridoxamine 5'-phosphate oxidase family protein [Sphingomonadales bacterium]
MDTHMRKAFWHAAETSPFMMVGLADRPTRPMTALLDKAAHHAIWFFTSRAGDLAPGGPAQIAYASRDHKLFATLSGTLLPETDRATFEKHWSNQVESWFPGGWSDPDLLFLRYDIAASEVWRVDMTIAGMFHMLTGRPVAPGEVGNHATGRV